MNRVTGDDELVEREERQLDLMRQRLLGFVAGEYGIGRVVTDLKGLLGALQTTSDDWIQEFRRSWGELEVDYAVALDRGEAAPDAKSPSIRDAVWRMLELVDQRRAEIRGISQTPNEIALEASKSAAVDSGSPCDAEAIRGCERALGRALPPVVRELYQNGDGRYRRDGQWWVIWPLHRLPSENRSAWHERGLPSSLLALGDDGTGDPFCVHLDGSADTIVRWSWIDGNALEEVPWSAFCVEWLGS